MEERLITNETAEYIIRVFMECLFPGITVSGNKTLSFTLQLKEKNMATNTIHFRYGTWLDKQFIGTALLHFYPEGEQNTTIVYTPNMSPWNLLEIVYEVTSLPYLIFTKQMIHTPEIESSLQGNDEQIRGFNKLLTNINGSQDD